MTTRHPQRAMLAVARVSVTRTRRALGTNKQAVDGKPTSCHPPNILAIEPPFPRLWHD